MSDLGRRVVTVLRSGGDFAPWHVQVMQWGLERWAPGAELTCLTDMEVDVPGVRTLPLIHKWPGWWSKLEMFRPDMKGDFLMTDLDNVFLGPLDDILSVSGHVTQRQGWNAIAHVPEAQRARVWEEFWRCGFHTAHRLFDHARGNGQPFGDAAFVATATPIDACWEDILPGQVVNIVECIKPTPFGPRYTGVPDGARVVLCATPQRRPWNLSQFRHLYEEKT